uniref:Polycystic kidney and hepatic disease 1 (autosomal recessive)-like 1 n=1 Tax=Ciona savignyi TaxID=51511 RepID=H2YQB4_CIOSA
RVSYATPKYGGKNGGTQLKIFGEGFAVPLEFAGNDPRKEVFLVNNVNQYECEIHEAESNENQVVCYTKHMTEGTYYVRMKINGVWLANTHYCNNQYTGWNCRFHVRSGKTPLVQSINATTLEPESLIKVRGKLFTSITDATTASATNGDASNSVRIWLTSGVCEHLKESDKPYGISLDGAEGDSNRGTLICKIKSKYVGNQNFSFIINDGHGRSSPYASTKLLSADNGIYMLQTYAVVTDVNPKQGSTAGGTSLTISGRNFANDSGIKARVMVGGQPCVVTSVTDSQIKCTTPAEPASKTQYAGGRGMRVEVFPGITNISATLDTSTSGNCFYTFHVDNSDIPSIIGSNFVSRIRGYFHPAVSGNYKFQLAGDAAELYVNAAGEDPSGKVDHLYFRHFSVVFATSSPVALQARTSYYYEILRLQTSSGSSIKLAIMSDTTNYTSEQTASAISDVQNISISSTLKQEIQSISLENWVPQTPVSSVWEVTTNCTGTSCDGHSFSILLFGTSTDPILFGASASEVKSALMLLVALNGEDLEVTYKEPTYNINFASNRGHMKLTATSNSPNVAVEASVLTMGVPKLDSFTLSVNGLVSAPVAYGAPASAVGEAIKGLFGPQCPKQLGKGLARNALVDYESIVGVTSGVRSVENSFCGIYSLKNPTNLFLQRDNPYFSIFQFQVSFAYIGDLNSYLYISYFYTDSNNEIVEIAHQQFYVADLINTNTWKHVSIDANNLLTTAHTTGSNFKVRQISLHDGSDTDMDLYVDNFFIASSVNLVSEQVQEFQRRIRPSAVPTIQLESVFVTKTNDVYDVIFFPANCGNDFPLLGVAFMNQVTPVSPNEDVYGGDWESNSSIRVSRTSSASPDVTGTFDIGFSDETFGNLRALPTDISSNDLALQLQSLAGVKDVSVVRSGNCYGYSWTATFLSPGGKYPDITTDGANMNGNSPIIESNRVTEGGLRMDPIFGDFFSTAHSDPQVQVFINNIPSKCEGDYDADSATSCGFQWQAGSTPLLASVAPSSGSSGDSITLTGTGFSATMDDNDVTIGGVACVVTAASKTSVTCMLGNSPGGRQPLAMKVAGKGWKTGSVSTAVATFAVTSTVTSIVPASGSTNGCTSVTITGSGGHFVFSTNKKLILNKHVFCSCFCHTCFHLGGYVFKIHVNVLIMASLFYKYLNAALIKKQNYSFFGKRATITGTGFGNTQGVVTFDDNAVTVVTWSDTSIEFESPALAPGSYPIKVNIPPYGCALNSAAPTATYAFSVNSMSPSSGSLVGGTTLTLVGTGFTSGATVTLGDVPCSDVTMASTSQLTCVTSSSGTTHTITNKGRHATYGIGYAWNPSYLEIEVGDDVNFIWAIPARVEGMMIGLYTTADAVSMNHNDDGFNYAPSLSGNYKHTFTKAGSYFFASGCVDNVCSVFMRGKIVVKPATSKMKILSVKLASHEATYPVSDLVAMLSAAPTFMFSNAPPRVTSISPLQGTTDTTINIAGSGFTSAPPSVTIMGKICTVISSSDTQLTCKVSATEEMPVAVDGTVVVNVASVGNALIEITNLRSRKFLLLPQVTAISPSTGSMAGGTKITVQGSGFTNTSTVSIGSIPCAVSASSYTSLVCVTPSVASAVTETLSITQSQMATCASCIFGFTNSATPSVTKRTEETTNRLSVPITFKGTGFGTTAGDVTITVGTQNCAVSMITDTMVKCGVGRFAAGNNNIVVHVAGKADSTISNPPLMYSITPNQGSIEGGTLITISGNGFVSEGLSVSVGDNDCRVTMVTFGSIVCTTVAHYAASTDVVVTSQGIAFPTMSYDYAAMSTPRVFTATPSEGLPGEQIALAGSGFGTVVAGTIVTLGGVLCNVTAVTDTQIDCTLGSRHGGTAPIKVNIAGKGDATVTATFKYTFGVLAVSPIQGSYGGGQQMTISGQGFSPQSIVKVCSAVCEVQSTTSTSITCLTPSNANSNDATTLCSVSITNGDGSVTNSAQYEYATLVTPVISSVSPAFGGTGGGTRITIAGSGFKPGSGTPIVTIDGSPCVVKSSTDDSIICVTEAHQESKKTKVQVSVGTLGIATQDNADYVYMDKWSSRLTWGGMNPPVASDLVIIKEGQTILLDTDTPVLKMLLIQGGKLIFDEKDVTLKSENILITDKGLLQIGTEKEPFQHKATIEMHGHPRSTELPLYGTKTLAVRNGTLEMHGKHVDVPWSVLAIGLCNGHQLITLQHSVTWKAGEEIVIATTGDMHSQRETEKKTISAVSSDGKTLTLASALEYDHLGVNEKFGSKTVEFRAEVGLLTRNIIFRGSNDHVGHDKTTECHDGFSNREFKTQNCIGERFGDTSDSGQFGAAIMFHAPDSGKATAVGHIENTEITNAGQAFRLGRYPIYFNMMGNVSGMYVRRCGIHNTFNRAVTIRGTHNLLVEHNVLYDVMGGGIFIEDGIETQNVIQYNLAVFVKPSTSSSDDDITPASCWVTNPNNVIRHNHAVGGTHFGFWYRMHEHPDGPSSTQNICPQNVKLREFKNNTVHSQGRTGLSIFPDYFPMEGGSCDSNVPSPAKFKNLTAWNCEKGAEGVNIGAIQFHNFILVNNLVTAVDLKTISGTIWGEKRGAMIKDATIVGHSSISAESMQTSVGIMLPLSSKLYINGVQFFNFDRNGAAAMAFASIEGTCSSMCGGFHYMTSGLSFKHVTRKVKFGREHEGVIFDRDGTLTGVPGSNVVAHSKILDPYKCKVQTGDMFSSGAHPASICAPGVTFHRFDLNTVRPLSFKGKTLHLSNKHGVSTSLFSKKQLPHKPGWMLLLPGGLTYKMHFENADQFTNISYTTQIFNLFPNDNLVLSQGLKYYPDKINGEKIDVESSTPLSPTSAHGSAYFDPDTLLFSYMVSGKQTVRRKRAISVEDANNRISRTVTISIYRCFHKDCAPPVEPADIPPSRKRPDNSQLWSQNSTCMQWTDNKNVVIPSSVTVNGVVVSCWVLVDVPTIKVDSLIVEGVIDFVQSTNVSAVYVVVQGGRLIAGSPLKPFTHKLVLELRGNQSTSSKIFPGIELGSKVLACFGGCDLHGKSHNVYKSDLAWTASIGASNITLPDAVDWVVGDEILITTTSYKSQETEKRFIASVSPDMKTLGLDFPLSYRHMGEGYSISGRMLDMRPEVALLTNIKIVGEVYDRIYKEGFGGRVLVATSTAQNGDQLNVMPISGWARLSNIELVRVGQEGWTEPFDPRFGVAFVRTGTVSPSRPSYVIACAFHELYSTGLGVFGASGINITDNVVHRAIHDGIRVTGSKHRLERNLVTTTLFRGAYGNRFELENYRDWHAAFELAEATDLVLVNNTAAGSERIGFHVDGEACDAGLENAWSGNVAHGCLHGVHVSRDDGIAPCSMLRNFVVYKSWDYGIYHQTSTSVVVRDTIIADSTVGYLPIIFAPAALSHTYADKSAKLEDVVFVGRSDHFDPFLDNMDETTDKNLIIRAEKRAAPRNPTGGKTGVMLPLFQSEPNGAPFNPFHINSNYPAIRGLLSVEGLIAHNFKLQPDGTRDLIFWTNPANKDVHHPTHLKDVILSNVEDASKVRFDRPCLGKKNTSNSANMECNAMKKVLIKDLDGSFLSSPGSIISATEVGWGHEPQRGLGDHRIPQAMLSSTDGTRIPVESLADKRGIITNDACTYKPDWQAYDCHGEGVMDYVMLVIESLDNDTETRRLSPVALLGGRTIDLNNGPQDHGRCDGYACQKRISTFYMIVATGTHFDIFFTGYTPRNMRLHLINVNSTQTVRLAIW